MVKPIKAIILFADIHGSTEFGYTQSLEMHNRMLRDFHKTCYEAIERFRQDKSLGAARVMATCRGDECCVFLCGGRTPEDELLAMNLAIYLKEMWKQSDFCRLNWRAADTGLIPQVDLRIGIGCGEVTLDHDVWSDAETLEGIFISEAKRIEGQADAASETLIMVKWDIREACIQAEAEVEFGPLMRLKGKGVPAVGEVPVCAVKTYAEWKAIQKKLTPSPQPYFERFGHALALRRSGDVEGAIKEYSELLKLRPDDPAVLNNRGVALDDLQRYEEALADYNRSLELGADDPATLNNRGSALTGLKRYEEALADFNRSLDLRPDDPDTLYNRGNALHYLRRDQEALADYNRSLQFGPDDPQTLDNRGVALAGLKRYEEALADHNRSLQLRPDHPAALNNRGATLLDLHRYEDALADVNRAVELRPDDPAMLNNRGNALHYLHREEEALADYNRSLEFRPHDPETLNNRGATLRHLKRYKEALADYNRSLELQPDRPDTLSNRGLALLHLNRRQEALADFNRAVELDPDDPSTLYNRACLFSLMSRYEEALQDLQEAVTRDGKYRPMAREDEDFEALRNDPQWGPKFWEIVGTED